MTLQRLLGQTATLSKWTAGTEDVYGNVTVTYTDGGVWPVRLEQTGGTETTVDEDTLISDWRLIGRADMPIGGRDRVTVDGITFEVVGPPAVQRTPRGPHHIEARLRHVA